MNLVDLMYDLDDEIGVTSDQEIDKVTKILLTMQLEVD